MSGKKCEIYDRECIDCGECERCDLDSSKICDNCCRCIESGSDYAEILISGIITDTEEAEAIEDI